MEKEVITDYARLVYRDGVYYCYANEGLLLTPEILLDTNKHGLILSGGEKHFVIADVSKDVSSTNEARVYAADNEYMVNHIAYAMIGKSLPVNMIANFFINFNKPKVPTRLFSSEEDALNWFRKEFGAKIP